MNDFSLFGRLTPTADAQIAPTATVRRAVGSRTRLAAEKPASVKSARNTANFAAVATPIFAAFDASAFGPTHRAMISQGGHNAEIARLSTEALQQLLKTLQQRLVANVRGIR